MEKFNNTAHVITAQPSALGREWIPQQSHGCGCPFVPTLSCLPRKGFLHWLDVANTLLHWLDVAHYGALVCLLEPFIP